MFPRKSVPELLKAGPVPRAQALAAGVGAAQLRGPNWKRMARGIYVWAGLPETPLSALEALAHRLPPGSAFSGMTAARVFGLELGLDQSVEVSAPLGLPLRRTGDWTVRHVSLGPGTRCATRACR
jgi:hypothetical protein